MKKSELDRKTIRSFSQDGVTYYAVVDAIEEFIDKTAGKKIWNNLSKSGLSLITLELPGGKATYLPVDEVIKIIDALTPKKTGKPQSGFDSILQGLVKVPKPGKD